MADSATQTAIIAASLDRCFSAAIDYESYPKWAHDVKEVVVHKRDAQGRATEVEYRASALGRSTHYTLAYDYSAAPARLEWKMVKGDIMRSIGGAYTFTSQDPNTTKVTYDVSVDLVIPLPGFIKRRAEVRIVNTLRELKALLES